MLCQALPPGQKLDESGFKVTSGDVRSVQQRRVGGGRRCGRGGWGEYEKCVLLSLLLTLVVVVVCLTMCLIVVLSLIVVVVVVVAALVVSLS